MTLMRGGWDGEGKEGIKREGRRKKGGGWGSCLWLWGLVVIVLTCYDFGRPWKPMEVSWVWEEESIVIWFCTFFLRTHYIWLDLSSNNPVRSSCHLSFAFYSCHKSAYQVDTKCNRKMCMIPSPWDVSTFRQWKSSSQLSYNSFSL